VLGAPELFPPGELQTLAEHEARAGRRVVAFGVARGPVDADAKPVIDEPLGLAVLRERLRTDARETVEFLQSQGVRIVILSGDRPDTVGAVAADVGIEGPVLDGRDLPRDPAALRRLLGEHAVIGRISPEDKKRVVETLTADGRYVAMVGDGVNDVPALKAARLAIAQGNGSQMARAVADLVLVQGDFSSVPALVAEGRRVLRNLQRVAKLFVA
jgi:cation-transporting ATPase E